MNPITVKALVDVTANGRTYQAGEFFRLESTTAIDLARARVVSLTQPPRGKALSAGRLTRTKVLTAAAPEPQEAAMEPALDAPAAAAEPTPSSRRRYRRRDLVAED